jgi:hypothetical protein
VGDHIKGAINRSIRDADFETQLDALPKHKTYLIHCKSGGRSAGAFSKMQQLSFSEVYEMKDGINAWKSAGYTTTSELLAKLMLVDYSKSNAQQNKTDTAHITITNRANKTLTFNSFSFIDEHTIEHNFNQQISLDGAEDYTFQLLHEVSDTPNDSTTIQLNSNGGTLDFKISQYNLSTDIAHKTTAHEIKVYPNPASDGVWIETDNNLPSGNIAIIDISGKKVLEIEHKSSRQRIETSGLKNGLYLLVISGENKRAIKKILIE